MRCGGSPPLPPSVHPPLQARSWRSSGRGAARPLPRPQERWRPGRLHRWAGRDGGWQGLQAAAHAGGAGAAVRSSQLQWGCSSPCLPVFSAMAVPPMLPAAMFMTRTPCQDRADVQYEGLQRTCIAWLHMHMPAALLPSPLPHPPLSLSPCRAGPACAETVWPSVSSGSSRASKQGRGHSCSWHMYACPWNADAGAATCQLQPVHLIKWAQPPPRKRTCRSRAERTWRRLQGRGRRRQPVGAAETRGGCPPPDGAIRRPSAGGQRLHAFEPAARQEAQQAQRTVGGVLGAAVERLHIAHTDDGAVALARWKAVTRRLRR